MDLHLKDKVIIVSGGAKGIGELPMDGPAPAILNAIENATGFTFNRIPLMPEEIAESVRIDSP